MSLTPKCDMFLESPGADQTGNVGKLGNKGKVAFVYLVEMPFCPFKMHPYIISQTALIIV